MAEFSDIAAHFDDVQVQDGYTSEPLFLAQFNTFDESSPDGSVVKRRTMSTRPSIAPPTHGVILVTGDRWVVGDGNTDSFRGQPVRRAFWTKKVTGLARFMSPGQAATNYPGRALYVHQAYMKDTVNTQTDSQYDPFWEFSYAASEQLRRGWFVFADNELHRVRTVHRDLNGMMTAQCDQLDEQCRVSVDLYASRTYNPVTDTYTGVAETHPAIMLDMIKMYNLRTDADPKMHSGDMTLVMHEDTPVTVGSELTIDDVRWQVLTRQRSYDAWQLHIRRQ